MAGLFALLYGALWSTSNIVDSVKNDSVLHQAKKSAELNHREIYYDRKHNPYWTETGEAVEIYTYNSEYIVIGKHSGKVYRDKIKENQNKRKEAFEDAIKIAKEQNLKYFSWYFDTEYTFSISYTGYDIEKQKKYIIIPMFQNFDVQKKYYLSYLNDKPNRDYVRESNYYRFPYGVEEYNGDTIEEYNYGFRKALDKDESMKNIKSYKGKIDKIISYEEFKERTIELEKYNNLEAQYYDRSTPFE